MVGSTACVDFQIIDDNRVELDPVLSVTLISTSPEGVRFSEPTSTAVTVLDNDGEFFSCIWCIYVPEWSMEMFQTLLCSCECDVWAVSIHCE